jgi:hypothetical protein
MILKGEDADKFLAEMNTHPVATPERLRWLQQVARESEAAEARGKSAEIKFGTLEESGRPRLPVTVGDHGFKSRTLRQI